MSDDEMLVYQMDELDELRRKLLGKDKWPEPRKRPVEDLDGKARRLLAEASLLSEVQAAGLNERTSHGKAGSKVLASHGASTFAQVRWTLRHWDRLDKDDNPLPTSKTERVDEAERILKLAKQRKRARVDCQTAEGRLLVGKEARDLTEDGKQGKDAVALVAWRYGYSVKHVYKLRTEYDETVRLLRRSA